MSLGWTVQLAAKPFGDITKRHELPIAPPLAPVPTEEPPSFPPHHSSTSDRETMAIFSTQSIRARTWSEEGAIETLKQLFPSISTRRSSSSAPDSLLSACVDDDRESMQLPDRMLPESSSSSRPQARSRASSLSKLGGTWLASTADAGRKRARSLLGRAASKTTR